MTDNLQEKTGKSMSEWLKITVGSDLEKHGQILKYLKTEHGVSHGFANSIALATLDARKGGPGSADDLVEAQYSGTKTGLLPIYEALIEVVKGFGTELEIAPKKANVSLRRKKQFAIIQPSTRTRVDVGINLKGDAVTDRLETSGSFSAMMSHRVRLSNVDDVDKELTSWLRSAYDRA